MEFKEKFRKVIDKLTFADQGEAEYLDFEEGGAVRDTGYYSDYESEKQPSSTTNTNTMRFAERSPRHNLRFYKVKGCEWQGIAKKAADEFRKGCTVMINTEEANKDSVTRLMDFLGGVAYSLDGRLIKNGTTGYAVIPETCDIGGDIGADIYEEASYQFGNAYV